MPCERSASVQPPRSGRGSRRHSPRAGRDAQPATPSTGIIEGQYRRLAEAWRRLMSDRYGKAYLREWSATARRGGARGLPDEADVDAMRFVSPRDTASDLSGENGWLGRGDARQSTWGSPLRR